MAEIIRGVPEFSPELVQFEKVAEYENLYYEVVFYTEAISNLQELGEINRNEYADLIARLEGYIRSKCFELQQTVSNRSELRRLDCSNIVLFKLRTHPTPAQHGGFIRGLVSKGATFFTQLWNEKIKNNAVRLLLNVAIHTFVMALAVLVYCQINAATTGVLNEGIVYIFQQVLGYSKILLGNMYYALYNALLTLTLATPILLYLYGDALYKWIENDAELVAERERYLQTREKARSIIPILMSRTYRNLKNMATGGSGRMLQFETIKNYFVFVDNVAVSIQKYIANITNEMKRKMNVILIAFTGRDFNQLVQPLREALSRGMHRENLVRLLIDMPPDDMMDEVDDINALVAEPEQPVAEEVRVIAEERQILAEEMAADLIEGLITDALDRAVPAPVSARGRRRRS